MQGQCAAQQDSQVSRSESLLGPCSFLSSPRVWRFQYVDRPPVQSNVKAVVKEQLGLAAKQMIPTTSASSHVRFFGILSVMYFTCASGIAATIAVRTTAGATALTQICHTCTRVSVNIRAEDCKATVALISRDRTSPSSANSLPITFVNPITAAFDVE